MPQPQIKLVLDPRGRQTWRALRLAPPLATDDLQLANGQRQVHSLTCRFVDN
jgi:hypothetical protein